MDLWYACHGSMQKEEVASPFAIRSKNEENFLFPTIRRPPHAPAGTGLQPCNSPGTALHDGPQVRCGLVHPAAMLHAAMSRQNEGEKGCLIRTYSGVKRSHRRKKVGEKL